MVITRLLSGSAVALMTFFASLNAYGVRDATGWEGLVPALVYTVGACAGVFLGVGLDDGR